MVKCRIYFSSYAFPRNVFLDSALCEHCSPIVSLITGFLLEAEVSEEAGNVCFTELIEAW